MNLAEVYKPNTAFSVDFVKQSAILWMAAVTKNNIAPYPVQISTFSGKGITTSSHVGAQLVHKAGRPSWNGNAYIIHDARPQFLKASRSP